MNVELTKSQKEAIYSDSSKILVNASAGSGKTSVFAARIVNLIENEKVNPKRILGLTFSKDGANNMRKRVIKYIGNVGNDIELSTFHSFAYKLLHSNFPKYYNHIQMMKSWWKLKTLSGIVGRPTNMNPDGLNIPVTAPELSMFVSYQKSNMILKGMPVVIDEKTGYVSEDLRESLQKAYEMFLERQKNARLIEYDDLLLHLYYRLYSSPEFRMEVADKYDYIMVDEFQDTSKINFEILKMIVKDNLFVVGDFRQSIYSFINADINNILEFKDNFKDAHVVELRENFRSTEKIVDLSNELIDGRNIEKYKQFDNAKSAIGIEGNDIQFKIFQTDEDEADAIVSKIKELVSEDYNDYQDFAILLRTNSQMSVYESLFAEEEMPVNISGGHSFFERSEIDVLLSYLKVMLDHSDNQSMARIINVPNRFISNNVQAALDKYAFAQKISIFEGMKSFSALSDRKPIQYLSEILSHFEESLDITPAKNILQYVLNSTKYSEHIMSTARTEVERQAKMESISSLIGISSNFENIEKFLKHIDMIKDNNKKSQKEAVNLMTVHSSKGLEFDHVFIPAVSDDYYPHDMCNGNYEEEARLLYVAITRAKYNLDLSYSANKTNGKGAYRKPSRFLNRIYPDLKQKQKLLYQGTDVVEV